jgi:hypothetical protein
MSPVQRNSKVLPASLVLSFLCGASAAAQQPKVLAPHVPVAPKLEKRFKWNKPSVRQSAVGGLWMTSANMKSSLYLKNGLKTDPLTVTPILYLSNGVRYPLPAVTLEPSGTAIVDINQGLASQGIAPYAQLSGYAEIEYQWPWATALATIRNVDQVNSLIFLYTLQQPPQDAPQAVAAASTTPTLHSFEGSWWKQEKNVSGFLALANVTGQPITATVRLTDRADAHLASYQFAISPHGTKMLTLTELLSTASDVGGVYVTHDGPDRALAINGGLVDQSVGYSAHLWMFPSPQPASTATAPAEPQAPSEYSFAELGLMSGAADPMMAFPSGTVFTPYSVVRNISDQPATVTPSLWWMAGGAPKSAHLPAITLPPHRTVDLNAPAMLAAAGLKDFNGSVNLILDTKGQDGALALTGGSVDQKYTYVFEVIPHGIGASSSKSLCYWSTGNGDDTMVTLWNPADEEQQLVFTLFYSGGHYVLPIPLGPRETRTFNISEVLHSAIPDAEGNVVPAGIYEGSAEIAGSLGEHQQILVSMDGGVYNVRKAICGVTCISCNGVVGSSIEVVPIVIGAGASAQEIFYEQWNTGAEINNNSNSSWGTSSTSIATVNVGLVTGVSPGSFTVGAEDLYYEAAYIPSFCTPAPVCPINVRVGGSGGGNIVPTVSFIGGNNFIFEGTDPTVTVWNQQQVQGNPTGGTFSWSATSTSSYNPQVLFNGSPSTYATSSDIVTATVSGALSSSLLDTTLSVSYSVNGQSAQSPATKAITVRQFEYLIQNGSIQNIFLNGPTKYGITSTVYYNVYTHPAEQILSPGFSNISVYEEVNVGQCNFLATANSGTGGLNSNSEIADDLSLTAPAPYLPQLAAR